MPRKNICKTSTSLISNSFFATRFILETDEATMKNPYTLTENRLCLIAKGKVNLNLSSTDFDLHTGDIIFCFKGEEFFATQTQNCEYMYIDFDGTRATELFKRFGIINSSRVFSGFDGLIPFWHESLSRASAENIDLSAESILLYTFSRLSANKPLGNPIVNKIMELSEEYFKQSDFSINTIADELGYNSKYLSHIFKEKTGATYSEYLRDLRIKYAVSLFNHGLESVKNVAALSGFSDPLYFSTVFKKCVGVTPKEYKKGRKS